MPSFDVVSEVDKSELCNAIDQTQREIANRFDFRGVETKVELEGDNVQLAAPSDFQLDQIREILKNKMIKRDIDTQSLTFKDPDVNVQKASQIVIVKQGIDQATAKTINKAIKESKIKVTAAIQGDKIRVTGKKRDDLQQVIALLKEGDFKLGLQFDNFRD